MDDVIENPAGEREAFERIVRRLDTERRPKTLPDLWYTIRVELVHGRGHVYEPPPGRDILISPQHTFRQLAELINSAFARRDLGHLYQFELHDGTSIGLPDWDDMEEEAVWGTRPKGPVVVWGWGSMPDQYGRKTPDGGDEAWEDA